MKESDKIWGYSGLVGELHIEVDGGKGNILLKRFNHLIQTLDIILPLLQESHELYAGRVDLSIINEINSEEVRFIEDLELESITILDIVPELKKIFGYHINCLFTKIDLDLNTIVFEQSKKLIIPESAELYIGTESSSNLKSEVENFISYSTFIDFWLSKTLDTDKNERDNTLHSQENRGRLRSFLENLDKTFPKNLELGESYYYGKYIKKYGF